MIVNKFWKSWAWLAASAGIALPEALQAIADHSDLIPFIDPEWKSAIRLTALVAVVLLRPIKQKDLQ